MVEFLEKTLRRYEMYLKKKNDPLVEHNITLVMLCDIRTILIKITHLPLLNCIFIIERNDVIDLSLKTVHLQSV